MTTSENDPTQFLSALTHELRTPLGSILMLSEMVMGNDGAQAVKRAERIHSLAQDLRALIDEVGELARLDSGRARIAIEDLSTHALVDEIERVLTTTGPASRPVIVSVAADTPAAVRTDRARVLDVINAIALAMIGGDDHAIAVRVEPAEGTLLAIHLLDTGAPLAGEEIEGLFEPFRSPSQRTCRAHGGQSLKLTIAHRVATLLGGRLTAQATPGGLELSLLLPTADRPQPARLRS